MDYDARTVLHIGFHKTGTSSIQAFLGRNRAELLLEDYQFYRGDPAADNHVELHGAAMRPGRLSTFRHLHAGRLGFDDAYRAAVAGRLAAFAADARGRRLLFSAEGLSLLRHDDEVTWLRDQLPGPVQIIAALRAPHAYRDSYIAELGRIALPLPPPAVDDFHYIAPDSWLWDYETRLAPWRRVFGAEAVKVLDYDAETARHGSMVPAFLEVLGVKDRFTPDTWEDIFLNRRG